MTTQPIFHRAGLLIGSEAIEALQTKRIILFGVGGVGSWCAEALIRTGVGHLTIVDSDLVCITNVNRQLQATKKNIGKVKVEELKDRLLSINPDADINALQDVYSEETRESFNLESYDYLIDAIDSLSCKLDLITTALSRNLKLFSAMGAACKLDPTRVKIADIWKTLGCPLAKRVRKELRRRGVKGKFLCVYSDELLPNKEDESACGTGKCMCPKSKTETGENADVWCSKKAQINGSLVHMTGIFGFQLAYLVINDVCKKHF